MPLIVGDWLKGTRGMKAEVKGVYLELLLYQWDNGFIPEDMEELKLIVPEVGKVWETIKCKFEKIAPGKLQNKKNEEVREYFSKQKDNGRKGGRPKGKKENPNNNPNGIPNNNLHNDIDTDNDSDLKSEDAFMGVQGEIPKSPHLKIVTHPQEAEVMIYPTFSDFWEMYDKDVGATACKLIWVNLLQHEKEKIMDYLPGYKIATPDKKYRKNPETFLINKSWNDEVIKQSTANTINRGGNSNLSQQYLDDLERRARG